MNHDRALLGAIRCRVLELEALRQVEVQLHGRHLPGTADGIASLNGNLRAVEGRACRVRDQLEAGLLRYRLQDLCRALPNLIRANVLVRILGGQLKVEVIQAIVLEQGNDELQNLGQLVFELLRGAVNMRVILGKAASAGQTVDNAGLLIAVDRSELEEAQR